MSAQSQRTDSAAALKNMHYGKCLSVHKHTNMASAAQPPPPITNFLSKNDSAVSEPSIPCFKPVVLKPADVGIEVPLYRFKDYNVVNENWWLKRCRSAQDRTVVSCTGFSPTICEELFLKYGGSPVIKEREDVFRVLGLLKISPETHQVPLLFGASNPTSLFN